MTIAFPGESAEYRAARNRLLEREIELRRAMEAVAAARRRLPPGGVVPQDYAFHGQGPGGGIAEVRLSESLDGAAEHAAQRVNLAVAGKAPIDRILTFAAERRWRHLRLLSSAGTTYNRDYLAETLDGEQQPMLNAFHRDQDAIRHFWDEQLSY